MSINVASTRGKKKAAPQTITGQVNPGAVTFFPHPILSDAAGEDNKLCRISSLSDSHVSSTWTVSSQCCLTLGWAVMASATSSVKCHGWAGKGMTQDPGQRTVPCFALTKLSAPWLRHCPAWTQPNLLIYQLLHVFFFQGNRLPWRVNRLRGLNCAAS